VSSFVDRFLGADNRAVLTYVPMPQDTATPSVQ